MDAGPFSFLFTQPLDGTTNIQNRPSLLIKLKNVQQLCRSVHVGNIQHVPRGSRYTKPALNLKN